jgi:hypothetical protein
MTQYKPLDGKESENELEMYRASSGQAWPIPALMDTDPSGFTIAGHRHTACDLPNELASKPLEWAYRVANFWRLLPFYHGSPDPANVVYTSSSRLLSVNLGRSRPFSSAHPESNSLDAGRLLLRMGVLHCGADPRVLDIYESRAPLADAHEFWDAELLRVAWIWATPMIFHTTTIPGAKIHIQDHVGVDLIVSRCAAGGGVLVDGVDSRGLSVPPGEYGVFVDGVGIRGLSVPRGGHGVGVDGRSIDEAEMEYCNYTLTADDLASLVNHTESETPGHHYPLHIEGGRLVATNDPDALNEPIMGADVPTALPPISGPGYIIYELLCLSENVYWVALTARTQTTQSHYFLDKD